MIRTALSVAVFLLALQCIANCGSLTLSSDHVDFTLQHGIQCRLTSEGDALWRLRTSEDGVDIQVGSAETFRAWSDAQKCRTQGNRDRRSDGAAIGDGLAG